MKNITKPNNGTRKLQHFLLKKIGKAIYDYRMIDSGDRILVGVSGGKDSLSLLQLLLLKKKYLQTKYSLIAAHVDFGLCPQHNSELDIFFKNHDIEYYVEKTSLPEKNNNKLSQCFWCSWNRRKILFSLAKKYGCCKVALGHHLDDVVETFMMNLYFHGEISTMPPKISMFNGEFHIIRPLVYVPEKSLYEYAVNSNLPFKRCVCPHSTNSRRKYVKGIIQELEKKCPYLKVNILRSMKRIKEKYLA